MAGLADFSDLSEYYILIDLLASEYGWTIETIQSLTIPEVSGLVRCILKRKGIIKGEDALEPTRKAPLSQKPNKSEMEDLVKLAAQLNASPEQLKNLKDGKGLVL